MRITCEKYREMRIRQRPFCADKGGERKKRSFLRVKRFWPANKGGKERDFLGRKGEFIADIFWKKIDF